MNLTAQARRVWRTPPAPPTAESRIIECDRGHDTVRWSRVVGRRCWLCHPEDWTAP